jgi:large subunit ribosomal protein L9
MSNIQVILQQPVKKLGNIADEVSVKAGYARNYLFPQEIAVPATEANRAKVSEMRAELEKKAASVLQAAQERAEQLAKVDITLSVNAKEEGELYGSIGADEIAKAFAEQGHTIIKSEVVLADGALKSLGEHTIGLQLHPEVQIDVNVVLKASA